MVNIIVPTNQPASMVYNSDTDQIQNGAMAVDGLEKLADQVGIIDSINNVNQESQQYDQQLREDHGLEDPSYSQINNEQFEEESVQNFPKKPQQKKKSKIDKRLDSVMTKYTTVLSEKEELEQELKRVRDENARYAASLLASEQERISHDIDRVADVMMTAQQNQQTEAYKKATKLMSKLVQEEAEAQRSLENLQESYQISNQHQQEFNQEMEEAFTQLADRRELKSQHYYEWLQDHPYYNAKDPENFDADLAQETYQIKKDFNKFLKRSGATDYIGSEEYYAELNQILHNTFNPFPQNNQMNNYQSEQHYNEGYNDGYDEYYDVNERDDSMRHTIQVNPDFENSIPGRRASEGQNRIHTGNPSMMSPYQSRPQMPNLAPANRGNSGGYYQQNQLPELTPLERKLALQMPMVDSQGRSLSEAERIHTYRQGKLQQMRR